MYRKNVVLLYVKPFIEGNKPIKVIKNKNNGKYICR